jgi:hypothetical protein
VLCVQTWCLCSCWLEAPVIRPITIVGAQWFVLEMAHSSDTLWEHLHCFSDTFCVMCDITIPGPVVLEMGAVTSGQFHHWVSQCSLQRDSKRPSQPYASPGTQSMSRPYTTG